MILILRLLIRCKPVLSGCMLLLMLLLHLSSTAQFNHERLNYAGKDFWLTQHVVGTGTLCAFIISGAHDANITFNYTSPASTQSYFLQGGTTLKITLTSAEVLSLGGLFQAVEVVDSKSLHITSDSDIVVQFVAVGGKDDDGMVLFPSENQGFGPDFYLNGPVVNGNIGNTSHHGSFSIVSRCDSTVIEITPSANTKLHAAGVPFNVTLHEGETYIISCGATVRDISGTKVRVVSSVCCNPINVFTTYRAQFMAWPLPPNNPPSCCADRLLEQQLPVNVWDTLHPIVRFRNNPYNLIKIVSASNNNIISFDGVPVKQLNAGQGFDTLIRNALIVKSSAPVSITEQMISQGQCFPGYPPIDSMSDPATLWVMPMRDGIHEAYIRPLAYMSNLSFPNNPPTEVNLLHVLTIISKASGINSIALNNVSLTSQFLPFPNNPDYKYAYIKLDSNVIYHLVSQERIIAYYGGSHNQASMVFPLGDLYSSNFVVSPVLSYLPDTISMCVKESATLQAVPADEYLWSDGSTGSSITVSEEGLYYVHMRYNDSCGSGGTKLFWVNVNDYKQELVQDTFYKCLNDVLTLNAGTGADEYEWSDGTTGQQLQVTATGDAYFVKETYQSQCSQTTRRFTVLPKPFEVPRINLGADTIICEGDQLKLTGAGNMTTWSTGYVGGTLTIDKPGTYWAMVQEQCVGLSASDTIVVADTVCDKSLCTLVFPSAFSPNGDGRNDVFRSVRRGLFTGYYLAVYNRWGEKVYQTYKQEEGWDGRYKGEPAELGVYYYLCSYDCPLKGSQMTKGEVTLVY